MFLRIKNIISLCNGQKKLMLYSFSKYFLSIDLSFHVPFDPKPPRLKAHFKNFVQGVNFECRRPRASRRHADRQGEDPGDERETVLLL